MDTNSFLEEKNFLPEDIELLLSHYDVADCDLFIRKMASYEGKPLILYGSEGRIKLAQTLAKKVYKDKASEYLTMVTSEEIIDYLNSLLHKLKGSMGDSEVVETGGSNEGITRYQSDSNLSEEELTTLTTSMVYPLEEDTESNLGSITEEEKESLGVTGVNEERHYKEKVTDSVEVGRPPIEKRAGPNTSPKKPEIIPNGLCRYSVPIFELKEIKPDVVGLKESLHEEFSQEELDDFFDRLSNKSIKSLEEGWVI